MWRGVGKACAQHALMATSSVAKWQLEKTVAQLEHQLVEFVDVEPPVAIRVESPHHRDGRRCARRKAHLPQRAVQPTHVQVAQPHCCTWAFMPCPSMARTTGLVTFACVSAWTEHPLFNEGIHPPEELPSEVILKVIQTLRDEGVSIEFHSDVQR